jgi:hypothetical protein
MPFVGSAEEVADEIQGWVEETGIDGFNLSRVVTPEGLEDFVDLVVPILQERGVSTRLPIARERCGRSSSEARRGACRIPMSARPIATEG